MVLSSIFPFLKCERRDNTNSTNQQTEVQLDHPPREANYKILDTRVIMDHRIANIIRTGFVEGILLIPSFVLEDVRHIADSTDLLQRNLGRRALDILNEISKETTIKVHIHEQDFEDVHEVDRKLVRLGQILKSPLLTNDYNLNKVATLQGVNVLNIDELANALKPIILSDLEMFQQEEKRLTWL